MVPSEGLEPPRREALGSKPSVATNYTNWARGKTFLSCKLEQVKLAKGTDEPCSSGFALRGTHPTFQQSTFYNQENASD